MMKRLNVAWIMALLVATIALPVLAAQGGPGGVHFGAYKLTAGDSISEDLVVLGPVMLEEDSQLNGDLTAFGAATIKDGASVSGDVVVFGALEVAGTVDGNVFTAGAISLQDTAHVSGNVAATGVIDQAEGATVDGNIEEVEEEDIPDLEFPFIAPVSVDVPSGPPAWVETLWRIGRSILTVLVMALFALLLSSIWPKEIERVSDTIVNAPIPAFGMGLLSFLIAAVVIAGLVITLCLSPLGLIGAVIVGLGVALGWVALGAILGDRILRGLFKASTVTPVGAAILGTVVVTLLAALVNLASECLFIILVLPLFALVAGAVTLTRFGTMPYASHGGTARPSAPVAPVAPAARRSWTEPVSSSEISLEPEGTEEVDLPSPDGELSDEETH